MGYWIYDDQRNEALYQNTDFNYEQFKKSRERNFFHTFYDGNKVVVEAPNGQMIKLSMVTEVQAIILFATVLGLKEQAAD